MANRLKMAQVNAIVTLHQSKHSNRRISQLLGVERETVGKYVNQVEAQNRPNAPTGCCGFTAVRAQRRGPHFRQRSQHRRFNYDTLLPRIGTEKITYRRNPFTCRF